MSQQSARAREQHPRAVWILCLHPAKINFFPLFGLGLEGNHPFFTRFSRSLVQTNSLKQGTTLCVCIFSIDENIVVLPENLHNFVVDLKVHKRRQALMLSTTGLE